ncbi:Thermonuclease precursor [Hartmannibacter diazotrophicus]|uniref:Thermonuclease n=1 Tax=Hartmannibacter diazotrophicus TaxID=1482074 RepID=A0A2C9D5R3_9HYPH|nr:thermonuclease family protein [Hartmannibacter diazotrophicus]SON55499.1 Thermonuclease precursor [Hartmannibacter diazotrophicus]
MARCLIAAALLVALVPAAGAESLPICGAGKRVSCVVDGDTLWFHREKIRLLGVDAPEVSDPKCANERRAGDEATRALQALLARGPIQLERHGKDRYGRTLARVYAGGMDVEQALLTGGYARVWPDGPKTWCDQ